jgi:hypothetical protein
MAKSHEHMDLRLDSIVSTILYLSSKIPYDSNELLKRSKSEGS